MRVLKYYLENKALFETWKWSVIILWGIKIYVKQYKKLLTIVSNLQIYRQFKLDFQKVDQHAGGKWLIHGTKRRKDNQPQSLQLPCRIS